LEVSIPAGTPVERYDVQKLIGAGAMGEVFLALDRELGRKVALKILSDAHRDNQELRARFIREARAVAAISHPNVVQVFTTGEFDGRPYFAMEYLAGRDLGTIVREKGPLSSRAAAASLLDAARGLEAAADAGLIHRDVKPSNLVRLDSGPVKVTDFGLAKPALQTGDPALTALGVVVGTPDYIAPEQARGEAIDHRVDVYALGCTAFYLLVGRPPFRRGNEDEDKYLKVVARHLREAPPDPRRHAPAAIDDALAELALAMMHKNAADRPGYAELIAKLDEIQARLAARAPTASRPAARPQTASRPAAAPRVEAARRPRLVVADDSATDETPPRRGWLWGVTAVSLAIFVTGLGLRVFARREAPAATLPPGAGPVETPVAAAPPPAPADAGEQAAPPPAEPAAPEGMILVRDASGKPLLFVDRAPVTHRAYAELIRSHRFARSAADRPVTGVSHDYAKAYAKMRGKRLLRDSEWQPALDTLGFVPAGMRTWEWIDDGREEAKDRPVRRVNEGADRRKPSGGKNITFRLAKDL
jgi:serine/threonine-protein kinase